MRVGEFICPYCGIILQWKALAQKSPYTCTDCYRIMMDVSKIIEKIEWRIAYHFGGKEAVVCSTFI